MSAPGVPTGGIPEPSAWAIEHADEIGFFQGPTPPGTVEVTLVTDPWSVWCWGFEPVRRALEHRWPTIAFRSRVGGMFAELPDPRRMGFRVDRFFAVVQRTTGMPLRLDATEGDRPDSTYPACVHVAAVRLLRPDLEATYLRRLREAIYLDARNVSRPEVAANIAADVGVPADEFVEALESGEPEREFQEALGRLEAASIHAYPTFLVRARDRLVRVEGYQTLPGLLNIVEGVSGRQHASRPPPPLESVIAPGERVATREVAEVFDWSVERAAEELKALAQEGVLLRERHELGDTWRRA